MLHKRSRSLALLLVSLVLLTGCDGSPSTRQTSTATVPLHTRLVQAQTRVHEQIWDGTVQPVAETTLAAQTNARVAALPVDVGDRVARGDVLVRFTDVEQHAALRNAQANVAAAEAAWKQADAQWRRMHEVWRKGVIARDRYDQAVAARDAARASLAAAKAQRQSAQQGQDYTVVRAPFDGVITHRYVHVGQAVQSGPPAPQPLIALAALDALRVEVQVPQREAQAIRQHPQADLLPLHGHGPRIRAGKVTVFPWADPASHSFRVRVQLPADAPDLYPGMTVKLAFPLGQSRSLAIPASALVRRGELVAVYVVGKDHTVRLRQLRVGAHEGDSVIVLAGLEAGERIATDPAAAARWLMAHRHRQTTP